MSAGISRVHGSAVIPSQRPSTISFFTLTIVSQDATGQVGVVNGVFDQVFRTAVGQFATVAMIGTPVYGSDTTLRFAIEDTGADANSASGLGLGNGAGAIDTTAHALQAAVRALGTINSIALASTNSTVTPFAL
jgi:hypothetical protein